ncbi:MAG: hypothetical protein WCA22_22785 [Candidatus Binatus sp.]
MSLRREVSPGKLVETVGGRFSAKLGIDLQSRDSSELFKWFLAAMLFGARISETLAARTYGEFAKRRLLEPKSITRCGWNGLVEVLDAGGYARYDFKTASKLLEVSKSLTDRYAGDLNRLHEAALDAHDLEDRLKKLGKGVGDTTVGIFLRELRGIWEKADPVPSELVIDAATCLRLIPRSLKNRRAILNLLKKKWRIESNRSKDFADFEAGLVRYGLALRRSRRSSNKLDFGN